jgi:Xaa-Pro aminopeptidase
MNHFLRRRESLTRAIDQAGLDALLVSKTVNVSYLTGFTGDSSFLLVLPKRAILLSDERFRTQIADECSGLEAELRGADRNTYQLIGQVVEQLGLRNVGVEAAGLTLEEFERLKGLVPATNWVPQGGHVEALRAIKDESEVAKIREAIRITEQAFTAMRATLRPDDSEKRVADLLDGYVRRIGGEGMAFPTIIGVGERSALPHCPVSDRQLSSGDFVLVDWGVTSGMYRSDLTRLLWTPGSRRGVENELQKIYTVVLEAHERAVAKIRPGVRVREVDVAARGFISDAGYGKLFNHGLGHGIGLEIHESPQVRGNSDDVLQAGMVITIEPGIYVPTLGGVRIEDDYLITAEGVERLTTLPRSWSDL